MKNPYYLIKNQIKSTNLYMQMAYDLWHARDSVERITVEKFESA